MIRPLFTHPYNNNAYKLRLFCCHGYLHSLCRGLWRQLIRLANNQVSEFKCVCLCVCKIQTILNDNHHVLDLKKKKHTKLVNPKGRPWGVCSISIHSTSRLISAFKILKLPPKNIYFFFMYLLDFYNTFFVPFGFFTSNSSLPTIL